MSYFEAQTAEPSFSPSIENELCTTETVLAWIFGVLFVIAQVILGYTCKTGELPPTVKCTVQVIRSSIRCCVQNVVNCNCLTCLIQGKIDQRGQSVQSESATEERGEVGETISTKYAKAKQIQSDIIKYVNDKNPSNIARITPVGIELITELDQALSRVTGQHNGEDLELCKYASETITHLKTLAAALFQTPIFPEDNSGLEMGPINLS